MNITGLNSSPSSPASNQNHLTSTQTAPSPHGVGDVRETVSSFADCGPCNPVWELLESIGASIKSAFASISEFFFELFEDDFDSSKISDFDSLELDDSDSPEIEDSTHPPEPPPVRHGAAMAIGAEIPSVVYEGLAVNPAKLADVPRPLNPETIRRIADNAVPPIEVDEILTQFDAISAGMRQNAILYIDQGSNITVRDARDSLRRSYVNFVHTQRDGGYYLYHRLAAADIDLFLKGIIFELRKPEIPIEKKRLAIENLASSAEHCVPRRHTESRKVYQKLSNQEETIEETIKQYIQVAKEDLFINFYSLTTETAATLNYIRREVGEQFGLDTNPVNLQDEYIGINDARSPENPHQAHRDAAQFIDVFNRIYTPSNILLHMKTFLNERFTTDADFLRRVSQFIDAEINRHRVAGVLTQAEVDMLPSPYQNEHTHPDEPFHLTDAGVRLLLVHFDILNAAVPNGHLVRA